MFCSLYISYLLGVATKKSLRYGFHYTWVGLAPKSKIVVVHAPDLEHARTLVRAKVTKLYPDAHPTCHWITLPQDHKSKLAETLRGLSALFRRTTLKKVLIVLVLVTLLTFLTSCSTYRFIQASKNFRKKVDAYTLKLTGATTYTLEPMQSDQVPEASPAHLERN